MVVEREREEEVVVVVCVRARRGQMNSYFSTLLTSWYCKREQYYAPSESREVGVDTNTIVLVLEAALIVAI
jgi:hypothetical protein